MSIALLVLSIAAAVVVLWRSTCVAAHLSRKEWGGHLLEFVGITGSYALICGGAVGIPIGYAPAPLMILVGVAGWILFDRRNPLQR